jgi:hypothetical protein
VRYSSTSRFTRHTHFATFPGLPVIGMKPDPWQSGHLAEARKAIAKAAATAAAKSRDHVLDLSRLDIDVIVQAALEVAEDARRFADLLRQQSANTRGHLSVIGHA